MSNTKEKEVFMEELHPNLDLTMKQILKHTGLTREELIIRLLNKYYDEHFYIVIAHNSLEDLIYIIERLKERK
jgi:hypothetical protein